MRNSLRKPTPDEKLLHIIENPGDRHKSGITKMRKMKFKKIGLRGVNKVLLWVGVVATLVLALYFVRDQRYTQLRFEALKKEDIGKEFLISKEEALPDISTYILKTTQNNPFHVLPLIDKDRAEKIEQKINLTLVGIIWSDKPQAVIEDSASKKNYLVYEGDSIDKFKVGEITQSEVRLTSKDGEKILR